MKSIFHTLILLLILGSCGTKVSEQKQAVQTDQTLLNGNEVIDLTHEFSDETIYWVTAKEFELDVVAKGETEKGYFYSANNFTTAEHGGTHIDAPIHFAENGRSLEEIPLEQLIGPAIKINVEKKALENRDYQITTEDFKNWEKQQEKKIPSRAIILLQTGYSQFYPDKLKYLGTEERGPEAVKLLHFPGLSPDAAQWLVENREINAIGIDTPSIDYGQSEDFASHVILMTRNIPAFENLTNLNKLPLEEFQVIALPMKIKGGSGGPLRIVALKKGNG